MAKKGNIKGGKEKGNKQAKQTEAKQKADWSIDRSKIVIGWKKINMEREKKIEDRK